MSTAPSSILDSLPLAVGCPRISSSTEALTIPAASDKGADEGGGGLDDRHGVCAICLEKIPLEETALVKGCEHAYCAIILSEFLNVHRSLDGWFEESVCLLLRAAWFVPLQVDTKDDAYDEDDDYLLLHGIEEEDDDMAGTYFVSMSSLPMGNGSWGENGYVRAGRKQARPVFYESFQETWCLQFFTKSGVQGQRGFKRWKRVAGKEGNEA